MFENEKFDRSEIMTLAGAHGEQDPLTYINDYNDQMSVSQVVRFFEKQGISITKTMIQNYVRLGVLRPPLHKRYYTKEHFMELTMLIKLKDVYPLEMFRDLFAAFRSAGDDAMSHCYDAFLELSREASRSLENLLPGILDTVQAKTDKMEGADSDKKGLALTFLTLMVHCAAAKQMADTFAKKYAK